MQKPKTYFPHLYLTGRAGSGKDTQAALLAPYGYTRIGLADPIKDYAARILMRGLTRADVEANKKLYRPLLIAMGQGFKHPRMLWYRLPFVPRHMRVHALAQWLTDEGGVAVSLSRVDEVFDELAPLLGDRDIWLKLFARNMKNVRGSIVVTDCRLPFEAKFFRKHGFRGARLYISEATARDRLYERDGTTDFSFFKNATEIHADQLPVDWTVDGAMDKDFVHTQLVHYLKGDL